MKDFKQIQSIIAEQNPWWKDQSVPDYLAPSTERPLARHLWKYILSSGLKRYFIILGPRRVGKTTVMYQTVRHLLNNHIPSDKIQWVRLDHPLLQPWDLGFIVKEAIKLAKAAKEKPLYLFLDELVYAKEWDKWLKTFFDEHWPVNIIASSSAAAALQKGRESGVGRWEEFHLTPYLLTELLQLYNKKIQFPNDKKKQPLQSTIENLSRSLPHTRIHFERERKLLISLGGFPEFLAGKKQEEEETVENMKKTIESNVYVFGSEAGLKAVSEAVSGDDAGRGKIYDIKSIEKSLKEISKMERDNQFDLWAAEQEAQHALNNKALEIAKNELSEHQELHDKIRKLKKQVVSMFLKVYAEQIKNKPFIKYFHKAQRILRPDAIERAIYKDIPQSYRIDSPMALERLFYVLAGQITGLLSPEQISRDIRVSVSTLERYLSYLIHSYLVFTLPNYDNNERNAQRRQRKTYFVDVAIRNAALQKDQIFNDSSEMGKLQENLVASHLYHLGKQSNIRLYHWRRGKHEVDLIYDDPVKPLAFEIGSSKTHSRSGLQRFLRENPKFKKGCYYVAPKLQFLSSEESSSGIGDLPLDSLLLAIGLQQDRALSFLLGSIEK